MPDPILNRALELLATPDKWAKGAYARDACNADTGPFDPAATCYCLDGALLLATAEANGSLEQMRLTAGMDAIDYISFDPAYTAAGSKLHELLPISGYVKFNDDPETTFADLRSVLDQAARA